MSNLENELAELARNWPGQSVADEVTRRLAEQNLRSQEQNEHPHKQSSVQTTASRARYIPWIGVVAASIAFVVFLQLSSPTSLHAALQRSLEQATSWRILVKTTGENGMKRVVEIWYHQDHGIRMQHDDRVTVDDGTHSHSWSTRAKDAKVLRRPSMDGITMVGELCDLSRVPKKWKQQPSAILDERIDGALCQAFIYDFDGAPQPNPLRQIVWVDKDQRPRKFITQEEVDGTWINEREMLITYEAPVEASTFALDYPKGAIVLDVQQQLIDRFPVDKALAQEERDGLLFAIHDLLPIDDRSYYVVSSVRGTPEYLEQNPPEKRRMNLDYTALDVARQSRSHGSCGKGQQILLYGMEWQGVDYLWFLFVPELQKRPTNGADEGFVRIPLHASGVHTATNCELDVPVKLETASTLETAVELAREDMSLVSMVFNETQSLPIARSMKDLTVQFTSFVEISNEDYAYELRKTRWQLENGEWKGNDPPAGFASKFTEEWVEPEDPTKHFKDTLLDLPKKVAGQIHDHEGKALAGAQIELKLQRHHPTEEIEKQDAVWKATTNDEGTYLLELSGAINQKYDEVHIKATKSGFVANWTVDYEKEILQGTLPELKLHLGREVTGRIVDEQGSPVAGAKLRVQSCNSDLSFLGDYGPQAVEDDGSFSILVPTDSAVAGVIYPKEHAPRHFEVFDSTDLGAITVSKGIQFQGRVVDKHGKGVADTIVGIRDTANLIIQDAYGVPIGLAVRTDDEGNFVLPHLDGEFLLTVTNSAPVYSERRMEVGVEPPEIEPLTIKTSELTLTDKILLREQP